MLKLDHSMGKSYKKLSTPYILFSLFAVALSVGGCKSKSYLPTETKMPFITIGNGGGFTGVVSTFYLMSNGDLFRSGFDDTSYVFIASIDATQSSQLFSTYKNLNLDKIQLNDPGNRYYFLSYNDKGETKKLTWGRNQLENKNIAVYHSNLMNIIKKKSQNDENKPKD